MDGIVVGDGGGEEQRGETRPVLRDHNDTHTTRGQDAFLRLAPVQRSATMGVVLSAHGYGKKRILPQLWHMTRSSEDRARCVTIDDRLTRHPWQAPRSIGTTATPPRIRRIRS